MEDDPYYVPVYDVNNKKIKRYRARKHPLEDWTEEEFRRRYRLTKNLAQDLIFEFSFWYPKPHHKNGGAIRLDDRFLLALRYLATGANYSAIAQTQGVSLASVTRCLYEVLDFFDAREHMYIKFPETRAEMLLASNEWYGEIHRPRCIGAMDGTHLAIRKPFYNEPAYINRKGYHSLNAMVICDSKKKFLHVDPCYGGSIGDALAYNNSELSDAANEGLLFDFYLLADSGYGLKKNVFIPHDRPTTDNDNRYNTWHRKSRSIVERAIGLWKQRWRCLDSSAGYLYHDPDVCSKIAMATACLHNICIDNNLAMEHDDEEDPDGFDPVQLPLPQPAQYVQPQEHVNTRTNYINTFFNAPIDDD